MSCNFELHKNTTLVVTVQVLADSIEITVLQKCDAVYTPAFRRNLEIDSEYEGCCHLRG